ncbi:MAG TPA: VTT domain-containing protein [Casimicrobiaceae bacterium]|nr:VTT domain-containing protein [Casimicrobiaceae bacterium]
MSSLIELVQHYGLAFVFVNVLLLQAGLPVPAWPTLIITGALAARSPYTLAGLLGTAVAASAIGNFAWYVAGRRLGGGVLKTLCRVSLSPDSCVRQTESIFERFGAPSLMFAKFVPGFASVATAMAGVVRIAPWRFVLFDAIGAALWSGVAIALGFVFRDAVGEVIAVLEELGRVGLLLLVAAFVAFVLVKWVQRQRFIRQLRMDRLTVAELRALLSSGEPTTVIDVRSKLSQSVTGRIPGAITVDATNLRVELLAIEPRSEVVVYCACPNEATAVKVAQALVQHGFRRVRPLLGGIDAWIAAGHEVEH